MPRNSGKTPSEETVSVDRRRTRERRKEDDRRTTNEPVSEERRSEEPRRKKTPRRRQIDPTTCERDYTDEEIEFMRALDDYKRRSGRMFPTCSELLEVVRALGYEKRAPGEAPRVASDDPVDVESASEEE